MTDPRTLKSRVTELLDKEQGLSVKAIAERLGLNRIYVSGFLDALEVEGYVKSKWIGPARAYFPTKTISRPRKT